MSIANEQIGWHCFLLFFMQDGKFAIKLIYNGINKSTLDALERSKNPMTQKLYIKTFGCQMNEYDSSRMADVLQASHGLELTEAY